MKIAFFTEGGHVGKYPRNFINSRTDVAWQIALDATHYSIQALGQVQEEYDLGIIIIPKKNIDVVSQIDIIGGMKACCKKISFMQEGPCSLWEDYPLQHQIWFYNTLMEMDFLFCHNECDRKYFKGLTDKICLWLPSVMIEDTIQPNNVDLDAVMIGGNFTSWYSGFNSYICASKSNLPIYAPSMGRKIEHEEQMDNLTHLPYMQWTEWINKIQEFKYGVHLMRTHAAGTYALNMAYWGRPCIGYRGLMTQEMCHPELSVDLNDIESACNLSERLTSDIGFYTEMCHKSSHLYEEHFSEEKFKERFYSYF